jgi:hypothetical protein
MATLRRPKRLNVPDLTGGFIYPVDYHQELPLPENNKLEVLPGTLNLLVNQNAGVDLEEYFVEMPSVAGTRNL